MTPGFVGFLGYDIADWTMGKELDALIALAAPSTKYTAVATPLNAVIKYLVGFCQNCAAEYDDTSALCLHHDHETGYCVAILCRSCNTREGMIANVVGPGHFAVFPADNWERTVRFAINVWHGWSPFSKCRLPPFLAERD